MIFRNGKYIWKCKKRRAGTGGVTYPFQNFTGCTVEVSEWMSNLKPHFIGLIIAYPCCKIMTRNFLKRGNYKWRI